MTAFDACPSTVTTTFDIPLPRKLSSRGTFTWSIDAIFGDGPAYKTGTAIPAMVAVTFASALRPLMPVPYSVRYVGESAPKFIGTATQVLALHWNTGTGDCDCGSFA